MNTDHFYKISWGRFPFDPILKRWVDQALPLARAAVVAKENAQWLRCGGTWFVGVNALTNDPTGKVGDRDLAGDAIEFVHQNIVPPGFEWDAAQISVCYPGYPQPGESESSAALRFRLERDSAHVDGLLPEGGQRQRHLREYHGFILGIPLVDFNEDASPFVVWEGSHEIIRAAFTQRFKGLGVDKWGDEDITEIYQQTRKQVFDSCKRVELHANPGEAFIVHRLAVHGVAPWQDGAVAGKDGRMICYFRPETGGPQTWLEAP